ncbi:sporulation protein [Priestia flexa]|nr:sporulation protein [Priestia flexa]UZW65643.1 sporulation protein [Priestia flexa]
MILRKYMSLLGVGSAQIDLILSKDQYCKDESVKGEFHLKGGIVEQEITRIECDLIVTDHQSKEEVMIGSTSLLTSRKIKNGHLEKLPFTFDLPTELLPSNDKRSYRFKTRLTFSEGVESKDQDQITITE